MRMIVFFILVSGFTFGNLATVASPDEASAQTDTSQKQDFLASSVDGIMIPNEVLSEVQLKYQGFAVVHAEETYRNSEIHYKLKVGRDLYDDKDSFYLIYDKDWKQVEKLAIVQPEPINIEAELEEEIREIEEEYQEMEEEIVEEMERIEEEATDAVEAETVKPEKPQKPQRVSEPTETAPEPAPEAGGERGSGEETEE